MSIGEKIYEYRTAQNLSQEELAERLEVSRQSVSKWETGAALPELDKLMRMCDIFGVSLDHLAGRTPTTPAPIHAPNEAAPYRSLGAVLIGVAIFGAVLLLLLAQNIEDLYILLPFLLGVLACGVFCLCLKAHVGYWCTWAVLAPISVLTPHICGLPFISAIGGTQLLIFVSMTFWASRSFSAANVKTGVFKTATLIAAAFLCLVSYAALMILAPFFSLYLFLNFTLYAAFALLLTYTVRYSKAAKSGK
jgi:transcriptional regulator with XRE-family HTH domain